MNMISNTSMTVDFSKSNGRIRPLLHGANLGPLCCSGTLDCSAEHRELGFSHIRTHDCPYTVPEAVDVHAIFPLFHRDAEDPGNYCFRVTDDYLQSIVDAGEKIYYRLGESIEHHTRGKYWIHPPADYHKWARICVNIIRHYNDGWADGFHHGIEYWEIWNEPANINKSQWTGTMEEFFELYAVTARAIKTYNPRLKVGGCSIAGAWVAPFMEFCARKRLPLDFYSHHWYGYRHDNIVQQIKDVRKLLDHAGFNQTESHLNEWNYLPGNANASWIKNPDQVKFKFDKMTGPDGASFCASAWIYFHDLSLDMAHFYHAIVGLYGVLDVYGHKTKVFYALKAFRNLLDTPVRVMSEGGRIETGLAVLAGKSEDGKLVRLLASNFQHASGVTTVDFRQLTWRSSSTCRIYMLDAHCDLEIVQTMNQPAGDFKLNLNLPPSTVVMVEIRARGNVK